MMNKKAMKRALVTGILGFFAGSLSADVIVLQDGSRIQGEVISMNGGQYQIRTDMLGVVDVASSKIRSIESGGSLSAPAASAPQANPSLEALQSKLSSDQGIMQMVLQLQSDPDMQAVLNDPEVMRAVQSFDLQALQSNPKIQKLMRNQKIQSIQGRVN